MKKLVSLFLLILGLQISLVNAQSPKAQRMVLAEEFTNASCGPCASQNPAFDALLQSNTSKVVSIKYHTNWPGVDPMNAHNPSDVGTRVTYYSVTGVPYCRLDGTAVTGSSYLGAPANLNQTKIDAEYAVASNYEIQLNTYVPPTNDSVYVTLLVHALNADSGQLVVHTGVIEKHIHFANPPGSNGETDFYNVMIKLLPGKNGATMPTHMDAGDYFINQYAWHFVNVYNPAEVAAVSFIQDNANKNVRQAALSTTNAVNAIYTNDATLTAVTNVPVSTCTPSLNPVVTIRNNGSAVLTDLDIEYYVNGGTPSIYHWTGSLNFLQKATINLPQIIFSINQTNTLTVHTSMPNGVSDDYTKNDTYNVGFIQAPFCCRKLSLMLKTDNIPAQTTWAVKDEAGQVVQTSGVLTAPNTITTTDISIPVDGCYTFEIYDAAGDGICCTNGYGFYQLVDSLGTVIAEGDKFGFQEVNAFSASGSVGIAENSKENGIKVFPNPFNDQVVVELSLNTPGNANVQLFNTLGSKVLENTYKNLSAGKNQIQLTVSDLSKGVYFLKVETAEGIYQSKITKEN